MGLFSWLAPDPNGDNYDSDGKLKQEVVDNIKESVKSGQYSSYMEAWKSGYKDFTHNRNAIHELKKMGAINQDEYEEMLEASKAARQEYEAEQERLREEAIGGDYN